VLRESAGAVQDPGNRYWGGTIDNRVHASFQHVLRVSHILALDPDLRLHSGNIANARVQEVAHDMARNALLAQRVRPDMG